MRAHEQQLTDRGAKLAFVGSGAPAAAKAFRDEHGLRWPVLSDPTCRAFAAAGMRRGLFATLRWRAVRNGLRAWRAGFRQTGVQGSPWQQGGALVFDAAGGLLHEQRDGAGGDPLDVAALAAAVG